MLDQGSGSPSQWNIAEEWLQHTGARLVSFVVIYSRQSAAKATGKSGTDARSPSERRHDVIVGGPWVRMGLRGSRVELRRSRAYARALRAAPVAGRYAAGRVKSRRPDLQHNDLHVTASPASSREPSAVRRTARSSSVTRADCASSQRISTLELILFDVLAARAGRAGHAEGQLALGDRPTPRPVEPHTLVTRLSLHGAPRASSAVGCVQIRGRPTSPPLTEDYDLIGGIRLRGVLSVDGCLTQDFSGG